MNIQEVVTLVKELHSKGKDINFVTDFLFDSKVYYFPAIYIVSNVYKIEDGVVEKLFYEHKGYKESMDQINPFNQDFIDFV